MIDIINRQSSESKLVFQDNHVLKSFPVESGLHHDVAIRILNYYISIGISIEYDIIHGNTRRNLGYFTTKFPILQLVPENYSDGDSKVDALLERVLSKDTIPVLEKLKTIKQCEKVTVHTRDTKSANLFIYNNEVYLLDIADFYFNLIDKNGIEVCLTKEEMDQFDIVFFSYKNDQMYDVPKYSYSYGQKGMLIDE